MASAGVLVMVFSVVAWEQWREAVLVMDGVAGVVVTLQYLVFGVHRMVNLVVWCMRRVV